MDKVVERIIAYHNKGCVNRSACWWRMDGWMDEWMDGWMNGWMDG